MRNGQNIKTDNFSLKLYDTLIGYDKINTIRLIKKADNKYVAKKEIQKTLLKGFTKLGKINDTVVELKFRNILIGNKNFDLPLSLICHYFDPTLHLFEDIYYYYFIKEESTSLVKSIQYLNELVGWPIETIYSLLQYDIKLFKDDFQDVIRKSTIDENIGERTENIFSDIIIKDPVKAWRPIFSFKPDGLQKLIKIKKNFKQTSKYYTKQSNLVSSRKIIELAELNEEIAKKADNDQDLKDSTVNTILCGIDLDEKSYVKKSIDRFHASAIKNDNDLSLLTTISLGNVYLGRYDSALDILRNIEKKYLSVYFLPSFIGSIASKTNKSPESANWFLIQLKKRLGPHYWPLRLFLRYTENDVREIEKILEGDNSYKFFLKGELFELINNEIDKVLPNIENITKSRFVHERKDDNYLKNDIKFDILVDNRKDATIVELNNGLHEIHPKLAELKKYYQRIIDQEAALREAQESKNYKQLQLTAITLDELWQKTKQEINTKFDDIEINKFRVDLEKNDSSILFILIDNIDEFLKNKENRERVEFERQVEKLHSLIANYQISDIEIHPDITKEELSTLIAQVNAIINRKKAENNLTKGSITLKEFLDCFEEKDREHILLNNFKKGECVLNDEIAKIITCVEWSRQNINTSFQLFCECIDDSVDNNIEDDFVDNVILPYICKIAEMQRLIPFEIIFENTKLCNIIIRYLKISKNESSRRFLDKIHPNSQKDIADIYSKLLKEHKDNLSIVNSFLKIYILKSKKLSVDAKTEILANYIDKINLMENSKLQSESIDLYVCLRDLLVEDSREDEATLLVSAVWSQFRDEIIFDNYERETFRLIISLIDAGTESRKIAYNILQTPNWVIEKKDGLIWLSYLCHIGNFADLFEYNKYQYFTHFEELKKQYPILIGEFFLKYRFSDNDSHADYDFKRSKYILGLNALEELKQGLLKTTCYNSWAAAVHYQKFFNERIESYLDTIMNKDVTIAKDLKPIIHSVDENEWILEANKKLNNVAKSPAKYLMKKYIKEQIERLKLLLDIKIKNKKNKLEDELRADIKPLKVKLKKELANIDKNQETIIQIYNKILETL